MTRAVKKPGDWTHPAVTATSPFAGLREKLGPLSPGPAPAVPREPKRPVVAWAVVRLERKGRAGKEVTVVGKAQPSRPASSLAGAATSRARWESAGRSRALSSCCKGISASD